MNHQVHSGLAGTQTEENLTQAFGGEARSGMRYRLYADAARRHGDPVLGGLFDRLAENEKEHAGIFMEYLDEIDGNRRNLQYAISGEDYENSVSYPEFAAVAESEGFHEIAEKFRLTAETEGEHKEELEAYLASLEDGSRFEGTEETTWICTNCGYPHTGKEPPERCPLCGHPRGYFEKQCD